MTAPPVSAGRLTILRAAGWSLGYLLLGYALAVGLALAGVVVERAMGLGTLESLTAPGAGSALLQGVCALIGFGFATWLVGFRALKLSPSDLRWFPPSIGLRGLGIGVLLGVVPALLAFGLALVLGQVQLVGDEGSAGDYLRQLSLTALVLAPAALSEEMMFRGVPQVILAKSVGRGGAVLALSLAFGLTHLLNPGPTPLAIGNIVLAGILLGIAFYFPGGLWTAFGAHLGWNVTLAALDAPVSGLPFKIPYIDYRSSGPDWLTGGGFGPEGGLLASVVLCLTIAVAARWVMRGEAG